MNRIFSISSIRLLLKDVLSIILLFIAGHLYATAQTNLLDGTTPAGLAPGSPAGSHSLSDLENINLYSGNLSFHLPLLKIGGRGSVGTAITRLIESHWTVDYSPCPIPGGGCGPTANPIFGWWTTTTPGYGLATMEGRSISTEETPCENTTNQGLYGTTLTRFTFTTADGTEYELRDQATDGRASSSIGKCAYGTTERGFDRGTVFVTKNGTAATFISDTIIYDSLISGYTFPNVAGPSGYLILRDGTRYRFDNGLVSWMRDSNGNRVTISYDTLSRPQSITDSLNRSVAITYADFQSIWYDQLNYKGVGGIQRSIKVWYSPLGQALRAGFTIQTVQQLFPELTGSATAFNPPVVSSVQLPNNQYYQFYYNSYSELSRVVLPTGGAVEYDWGAGPGATGPSGALFDRIVRRVTERRVYPDGGTLEGKTSYSAAINHTSNPFSVVTIDHLNPAGSLLSREKHYFYGDPAYSLNEYLPAYYPGWVEGKEYRIELLAADGATVLKRQNMTWRQQLLGIWMTAGSGADINPISDPHIAEITTTLLDANQVTKQTFDYDAYSNEIDRLEYAYGSGSPGSLLRRTHTDYLTTNQWQGGVNYATDLNIHIRNLPKEVKVYNGNGALVSRTLMSYDRYELFALHTYPDIAQHDPGFDGGYLLRGNLMKITKMLTLDPEVDPENSETDSTLYINNISEYDIAGNVVKTWDGKNNWTEFDYSDRFGQPNGEAQSNTAPTELNGQFSYAFPTKVTNALGHKFYTQYDFYAGLKVDVEDQNNVKSSFYYQDTLDRPTKSISAVGTPAATQTIIVYNDGNSASGSYPAHSITTIGDKDTFGESSGGGGLKSLVLYDGLGRTWRNAGYEGSTWTITDTQFDALGKAYRVSNPFRLTSPDGAAGTSEWTTTDFDALGRVIRVTTPDGAQINTVYSGSDVTVTDQAGKSRRSKTDALGRLIEVIEAPGVADYGTAYIYDALDNLRQVTQGDQKRYFAYDAMSRLIRARNPEQDVRGSLPAYTDSVTNNSSWTTAYSYDANSNLTQRIDARGIITDYYYDVLNRNSRIEYTYNSNTNYVIKIYDGATNGKGRFYYQWTERDGAPIVQNVIESYDPLGRPLSTGQEFRQGSNWGTRFYTQYTYNLAGNVKTMTYPSGHTVNYSYDQSGRLSSYSGNLGGGSSLTYADQIGYSPAGQMTVERFGTQIQLYLKRRYNNRQQLGDIRLSTLTDVENYDRGAILFYHGPNAANATNPFANDPTNNGNLVRQAHYVPTSSGVAVVPQADAYTYDALNRIASYVEWQYDANGTGIPNVVTQNFSYDRYGNRKITSATGGVSSYNPTYILTTNNEPTNRIVGLTYDAAGSITKYQVTDLDMTYDEENRLLTAPTGGGGAYTYNADGERVRRTVAGQIWWYIYGVGGELLAEYQANATPTAVSKEYGYRNGQLQVVWDSAEAGDRQFQWLVQDHLGSTRMIADRSGSLVGIKRQDFAPYGELLAAGIRSSAYGYAGNNVRQKFGAYEKDDETGLDFAQARYFASIQGRFTSSDITFADQQIGNPQSWNLYSYAKNNPTTLVDPSGRSTHTDINGIVIAVYNDNDLGVYRHTNYGPENEWDKKSALPKSGKHVNKMGTTKDWDEFSYHDPSGKAFERPAEGAVIQFGESWDNTIAEYHELSRGMDLKEIGQNSKNGGLFDIKSRTDVVGIHGPNVGRLLNGEYATARSAGNYLAGLNGATSTIFDHYILLSTYMKMAGALQQRQYNTWNAFKIGVTNSSFGPPPWYGEIEYTGRRVIEGFSAGELEVRKKTGNFPVRW